jgi:hypothetical protein
MESVPSIKILRYACSRRVALQQRGSSSKKRVISPAARFAVRLRFQSLTGCNIFLDEPVDTDVSENKRASSKVQCNSPMQKIDIFR